MGPAPSEETSAVENEADASASATLDVLNVTSPVHSPLRGDRAVPCDGDGESSPLPVAKAASSKQPMVRLQPVAPASIGKRAHPESYTVVRPQYLNMTPARLLARWRTMQVPVDPLFFFDRDPIVRPNYHLSNWYVSTKFTFQLPEWCRRDWVASNGAPVEVSATFGEKPLMLCKAALMRDLSSYRAILNAATPEAVKALGKKVTPFDEALWLSRVCAVDVAVVRARVAHLDGLRQVLVVNAGRVIAESSPRDRLHGIGLDSTNHEAMTGAFSG